MTIRDNWDEVFTTRLSRCYDEMKWLYGELYYGDEKAFDYFLTMLYNNYSTRKPELKRLDETREASPAWYKDGSLIGMLMYTQCFSKDLKGVEEHLDYIRECGVNYLHLMPLLQSPEGRSDGGYAVSDFRSVDPALGTMEDLENLADACHGRGMSLCLDFVMNHTSEDHEWARRARAGEKEYQDRYFFFDNWSIPNEFEHYVPQVFPTTAPGNFSWCSEVGKVVMTTFYPYQWDLNYCNPTVFNDMTDNMLNLCNKGVDVIRLDAVPYIWKQLGTSCRNLKQVHTLVRLMRMACEVVCPGTLLLGEVVMEPSKVVPYFGTVEKPECHILYNVTTMATTWHTVATKDVRLLKHQLGTVFALPGEYTFLNYLRCHDDIGWGLDYGFLKQFGVEEVAHKKFLNDYFRGHMYGSYARGELYNDDPRLGDARLCGTTASLCGIEAALYERDDEKLEKALRLDIMLHAFLFTQSGIPVLYSGDEIAQENDYTYHENPLKWDDSRYLHRGNLDWDKAEKRKDPESVQGRMFDAVKTLEKLRLAHPVFRDSADVWLVETWNDHVLGIGRYYEGEKLIALFNFNDTDETAWVNEHEDYIDLLTGEARPAKGVGIPAGGFVWLLTDFNREEKERAAAEAAEAEKKKAAKKAAAKKTAVKKPAAKKSASKAVSGKAAGKKVEKKAAVKEEAAKAAEEKAAVKEEATKEAETKAAVKEEATKEVETKAAVKEEAAKEASAAKDSVKKPVAKKTAVKKKTEAKMEAAAPEEKQEKKTESEKA